MPSLAAHLREPDGHDRLPFHPSCPICREMRLTGRLPADDLLSARTQALLAAGVLAVSSTAPAAVAVAAEQDQQQDGTGSVTQSTTDAADNPDFDPGGVATDLPQTAPPVAQTQAPAVPENDDTAPVDQAPAANPDDPVVDAGDGSDATPAPSAPAAPPADTSTPPTTAATATPTPPPAATEAAPPVVATPGATTPEASTPPAAAVRTVRRTPRSSRAGRRSHHPAKTTPRSSVPVTSAPSAPVATDAPSASYPAAPAAVAGPRAKPDDHAHTVLPGESLWTIATDVLGSDASTAQVAREVHRLWQLNHDRIGTGDPDLLMVGTRLELR